MNNIQGRYDRECGPHIDCLKVETELGLRNLGPVGTRVSYCDDLPESEDQNDPIPLALGLERW